MTTEHFIVGKDASLESSIDRRQEKLLAIGFHVVERSWLNPADGICALPFTLLSDDTCVRRPVKRQQHFLGITLPGKELNGFEMHHRLPEAYGKMHRHHATEY